ncbi:hypothetical protein O3P69_008667 [Scylla paramamosain]|uniref:Uncharacterized protein n=1 Tax=Scylla paramamosain TaxID=85552 RepID=A0AAW0SM77_SCYPA
MKTAILCGGEEGIGGRLSLQVKTAASLSGGCRLCLVSVAGRHGDANVVMEQQLNMATRHDILS